MQARRTSSPRRPAAARQPAPGARFDWRERAREYWLLMRGDRPIGIALLLWPTWWALWLAAEGVPPWHLWLIFTLGVFLMRSAGCVINDYADRWLDPQVRRTRERPLAAGRVAGREALMLFAVLCLLAFGLVLLTNRLTVYLSFAGVALAATYPYLKRYTWYPQVYLGVAFGWAIPMSFAAVRGEVPALGWLLFLANVLWATAYDTWYAMVDRDDDLRVGAKSTAILLGDADLIGIAVLQGAFLATLLLVATRAGLAVGWFHAGVGVAALLVLWQLWYARDRSPERCFRAFLNNNWVGMAVFAGLAAQLLMR